MNQARAEVACIPSTSGVNFFCMPSATPTTSKYVTKAINGMYMSGAFTSSLGGTAWLSSDCEYFIDQSFLCVWFDFLCLK